MQRLTYTTLIPCLIGALGLAACGDDGGDDGSAETSAGSATGTGADTTTGDSATTTGDSRTTTGDSRTTTGDSDTTGTDTGSGSSTAGADSSSGGTTAATTGGESSIPTDPAALLPWLEAGNYDTWDAEGAIHDPVGDSPHGRVRVFFNPDLIASFDAENAEHPVGAASVKELYDETDMLTGWAVFVKTEAGTDANTWYMYVHNNGAEAASGNGIAGCAGCHAAGVDYITTQYPFAF